MKKLTVSVFVMLLLAGVRAGLGDCKCFKVPFDPDPPCFARCSTNLLAMADVGDLISIFKFDRETAEAIVEARKNISSPDQDLLTFLNQAQRAAVGESFKHADNNELLSFIAQKSLGEDEREPFVSYVLASIPPSAPEQALLGAVRRASEEGKIEEGKLLYETVLSDDNVKFGFDTSELSPESRAALDEFAGRIASANKDVFIEIQGHTDSVGPQKYNEEVGLLRAEAVRRYLNQKHGIPVQRMNVISYGEQIPVAENATREGRSQNRRVSLVVLQ